MLTQAMEYAIKQGFGRSRVKEYFIIQADGNTRLGVVAGPFESERQCEGALEALRPLYSRRLCWVSGHLVSWKWKDWPADMVDGSAASTRIIPSE